MMIKGSLVAIVTPMHDDGSLDLDKYRSLIDWHIESGTAAIVAVGTTGESPTVSVEEHQELIRVAVEHARGRVPIIAGTGANSTREAIELTRHAKEFGAQATLQVAPYYNKPTQEGLYRHFMTLADKVDLPIVLYNIPGRTASNMLPETIARMAAIPSIVAVKEATGSLDQASQVAALCGLTILSGDDSLTLPLMSIGARGVVSVVGNVVPRDMTALVKAFAAGKLDEALRWHRKLFPLCRDMLGVATNPIPVKTAMKLLGRGTGELRLPMCALDAAGEARVRQTLTEYGL
jgi:4-hydroxy-tetrahydrodipicolinate synthase